ncbi:HAD-IA family hydrolase [Rhodospirillaceae bacterium KN72]|uniref:HAD-IA family hydrolase n=1 Tax=Pacificispira spongiicola TaxID=2729598 RepID=A0A7Y0E0P9_9PROT|nr:HAD family hydrolase [Pacificispira spongiicola]NMM44326.1 HAD-IA family hydrolase [Pacificispira spongiicola]
MIIFDCDGVLVDTETISNRVFAEMLTESGYPITPQQAHDRFKGGRFKTIVPALSEEHGLNLADDWLDRFFERQFAALERETQPIPDINRVLDGLEGAGIGFCVASQASVAKMRVTLGVADLWHRFDGRIFSADMVPKPKPFPDLFLHAAETMGWQPEAVIVVEDSSTGVKAARAAGMRVIGYARDGEGADGLQDAGATHVVTGMDAVARYIGVGWV